MERTIEIGSVLDGAERSERSCPARLFAGSKWPGFSLSIVGHKGRFAKTLRAILDVGVLRIEGILGM